MVKNIKKLVFFLLAVAVLLTLAYFSRYFYYGSLTVHQLLTENRQLKQAITNLTHEDQIGYARLISQETRSGRLISTIKFVETARDDKLRQIFSKEYSLDGDVIHFDALIVKFGEQMVMDGRQRSLYLWRRVYSDSQAPENGFPIEETGSEPHRYRDLLSLLTAEQRKLFWTSIWDLAHDPDRLQKYGITAIYGNVVYSRLSPGFIYIFKISPTGQLYPEIIPDM